MATATRSQVGIGAPPRSERRAGPAPDSFCAAQGARGNQRRRLCILTAASGVFACRGYAATSLADLLAAADLDEPAFRSHFAGPEDCFLALHENLLETAADRLAATYDAASTWADAIAAALDQALSLICEHPDAARLLFIEAPLVPGRDLRFEAIYCAVPYMRQGRELAACDRELPVIEAPLLWLASHLIARDIERDIPPQRLRRRLLQVLLTPYLGPSAAARYVRARPPAAPIVKWWATR